MRLAPLALAVWFTSAALAAMFAPARAATLAAKAAGAGGAVAPVHVYPSGPTVPQRLLRISLVFARAQDESVAQTLALGERGGSDASHPFADPPLWSADGRTLTLLLDPSRQKLGLANQRALGFVLPARERVQLVLGGRAVKTWRVTAGGCPPLAPARWSIRPVRAGSREPLVVRFGAPIDVGSGPYLALAAANGTRVGGRARLADAERTWSFVPAVAWRRGDRLAVHPRLEDPCGNEVGEPFEHAPGTGLGSERKTTFVPLTITPPRAAPANTPPRAAPANATPRAAPAKR